MNFIQGQLNQIIINLFKPTEKEILFEISYKRKLQTLIRTRMYINIVSRMLSVLSGWYCCGVRALWR